MNDESNEKTDENKEDSSEQSSQIVEDDSKPKLLRQGSNVIDIQMMHLNKKSPGGTCGYCKSKKENPGSASWGVGLLRLSVKDYELMMDLGWRRCGTYTYKYDLEQSCCQPYTIRLDVSEF